MLRVEISRRKRSKVRFFHETHRRFEVPESWTEIPAPKRVSVLRLLVDMPGTPGELEALRLLMGLSKNKMKRLHPGAVAELLDLCQWTQLKPAPVPLVEFFEHKTVRYHLPVAHFRNGACIEYPMADECLLAYLDDETPEKLLRLVAVLCREELPNPAEARRRNDPRVPLHSWAEVDARAEALRGLHPGIGTAVLLYFAGVKQYVFDTFGGWLFEPTDPDTPPEERPKGDPLGWWGLYMDAANNDPARLREIHQSNFETFCLMEVRRRKAAKQAEVESRMASPDWGGSQ